MSSSNKYILINGLIKIAEFLVDSFATLYILSKGASYTQLGIMWTLYLGIIAVTDYPTGGFADKFGRKKIYTYGVILTAISYYLMLSPHTLVLYISYMVKGVATSLISGSLTAWLACDLKDSEIFKDTVAKSSLVSNVICFVLPIIVLLFVNINMDIVFIVSASIHLVVGIIVIRFLEENYGSQVNMKKLYSNSFHYFIKNRVLLFITFVNVVLYLYFTIFNYIWQPVSNDVLPHERYLPVLYGVYSLSTGISAYCVKFIKKINAKNLSVLAMTIYTLCFGCFYFAGVSGKKILVIGAMILFGMSGGIVFMLINIFVNRNTLKEYMSSVCSLMSSICTVSNIIFQFVFGIIIDQYGMKFLTVIAVITSVVIACGFLKLKEKKFE